MARQIVECVPNFSEGRDPAAVDAIASAISSVQRIAVLHQTMDADHNRSVITFAGEPEKIVEAAVLGVQKAAGLIDLNRHRGVHPRIGAADVIPFVPVQGVTLEVCATLAAAAGEEIWRRLRIPVYLYEAAAKHTDRKRLEDVRRAATGNPHGLPDIGGPEFHPTAGAAAVGARKFLIAWNVNLATTDVAVAKAIARKIRASSGGFPHVKALGLLLNTRGHAQVSMNLTDFEVTPMQAVFDAIECEAVRYGTEILESEIIGLIPAAALGNTTASRLQIKDFDSSMIFENRLPTTSR